MKTIEDHKTYWLKKLSGQSGLVTLPADREGPIVSSFLRETVCRTMEAAVYSRIKSRATNESSSSFVLLLAALNGAIYRYTGSNDIRIGALIDANLVIIRTWLSGR